jgi:hypothetical protein
VVKKTFGGIGKKDYFCTLEFMPPKAAINWKLTDIIIISNGNYR